MYCIVCVCCSEHALNCTKQCFNYLTMSITDVRVFARLLIIVYVHWDSETVAYTFWHTVPIYSSGWERRPTMYSKNGTTEKCVHIM